MRCFFVKRIFDVKCRLKNWRAEFADAEFILEDGKYITRNVKSRKNVKIENPNVVNPDDIAEEYGADCFTFVLKSYLGPLEQSKPWNTQGLSGVYGFLKKFYNLYFDGDTLPWFQTKNLPKQELKVLHTLIKKFTFDIQNFSILILRFRRLCIAVNELQKLKCK